MNLPRPTSPLGRRASVAASAAGEEDDGPKTSMEAVEHLSRNSQKGKRRCSRMLTGGFLPRCSTGAGAGADVALRFALHMCSVL